MELDLGHMILEELNNASITFATLPALVIIRNEIKATDPNNELRLYALRDAARAAIARQHEQFAATAITQAVA